MRVNVFGIAVVLMGIFSVFLGVTGRYKVFTSGGPSPSSAGASPAGLLPNQGGVPASNTAVPGITFSVMNQNPVPTIGNLPPISSQPTAQSQGIWQSILQGIKIGTHS